MRTCLLLLSFLLTPSAFADLRTDDMSRLSKIPAKYEVFGTICEYLTMLRLEEMYPASDYRIEVGIEYRVRNRVIGEIDVVVFRNTDMEAILVGQVKCRKSMNSARKHANEQNHRFAEVIFTGDCNTVTYRSTSDSSLAIHPSQMDEVATFLTASQDGGEDYGFDLTIGHDLDAVTNMRDELLSCQKANRCPQPH